MKSLGAVLVILPLVGGLLGPSPLASAEIRVITGPGISPPPVLGGAPRRVEPPAPPVKPAAPIVERRLGPVVIESAADIRAGKLKIRLPGVVAAGLDESCRDGEGHTWACGRRALAAVRRLVRLRPVACLLPSDARSGSYEAPCRLGGDDLGERFVAAGWARAASGGSLVEREAEAKAAGRGLWGRAPEVVALPDMPLPPGDALPPDLTTAPLSSAGEALGAERGSPSTAPIAPGR